MFVEELDPLPRRTSDHGRLGGLGVAAARLSAIGELSPALFGAAFRTDAAGPLGADYLRFFRPGAPECGSGCPNWAC